MKAIPFLFLTLITACTSPDSGSSSLNYEITRAFDLDSANVVYQYYQKFGFTDVCEDIRMVSRPNNALELEKPLPISEEDLERINGLSNKTDRMTTQSMDLSYNLRSNFQDIELAYNLYIRDSIPTILLEEGSYDLQVANNSGILHVFDATSGLLYVEVHRCDE